MTRNGGVAVEMQVDRAYRHRHRRVEDYNELAANVDAIAATAVSNKTCDAVVLL